MSISFRNYYANGQLNSNSEVPSGAEVPLLTGAANGSVVKTLEIGTGNESCYVEIIRRAPAMVGDSNQLGVEYSRIKVDMKAYDYLVLWEGFFVIPSGHTLSFVADSEYCTIIANVVEL